MYLDTDLSALQDWQHIPSSLNEIASLARYSEKLFWKELRTSSSAYKYNKETSPVFILPSLKKDQMKELTNSLFYPAFEAVLPSYFDDADDLTQQLFAVSKSLIVIFLDYNFSWIHFMKPHDIFQGLEKFSSSVFTIICSDWMWMLGLKLGSLLEKSGKTVSLILLGISPQWAKPESVRRVSNFLK